MIQHSKKMEIFSPAIFGDLKKAANEKAKTGVKIIDLSLGSPDLPPNEKIRKTLSDALQYNVSLSPEACQTDVLILSPDG